MPKHKLASALASHQAAVARAAQKKRADSARKAKEEAVERSIRTNGKKAKRPTSHAAPSSGGAQSKEDGVKIKDKGKRKATIPFDNDDTILLLGEANFSFALSLLTHHHHPPSRLAATSYDSQDVCFTKYPDAEENVEKLREAGVRVEFGVDAGRLETCKWVGKGRWSRVIFNFPHAGAGITDQDRNILSNQILLLRTFRSVAPILTSGPSRFPVSSSSKTKSTAQQKAKRPRSPTSDDEEPAAAEFEVEDDEDAGWSELVTAKEETSKDGPPNREGTILITLLDQPPYTLWDLRKLALRPPALIPSDTSKAPTRRYRLLRSFEFSPAVYPGYAHRRTLGFKEGVSKARNEEIEGRKGGARTWEFAPLPLTLRQDQH